MRTRCGPKDDRVNYLLTAPSISREGIAEISEKQAAEVAPASDHEGEASASDASPGE